MWFGPSGFGDSGWDTAVQHSSVQVAHLKDFQLFMDKVMCVSFLQIFTPFIAIANIYCLLNAFSMTHVTIVCIDSAKHGRVQRSRSFELWLVGPFQRSFSFVVQKLRVEVGEISNLSFIINLL
jgi:hypothetical protein